MSDKILRALMQLFAIVADGYTSGSNNRSIVESFLKQQLRSNLVEKYLGVFDEFLLHNSSNADTEKQRKRISVNSVKVLRICSDINRELNQRQKYVVLMRLIEFMFSADKNISEQEKEFAKTVAEVFNIPTEEYNASFTLITTQNNFLPESSLFLKIDNKEKQQTELTKHLYNESLNGVIWMLFLKSTGIFFIRYLGDEQLLMNGQLLTTDRVQVLTQGSVIRGAKTEAIYYSDVVRCFFQDEHQIEISFSIREIEYQFSNGKKGLNELSFDASSGNLIAIMGGSGAGKSTLLNVLNGNFIPSNGEVLVNGINLHREKKKLEGVVGFIPQDDMLMEELTVFENLFYNSKLCFANLDDEGISQKVEALLDALGLSDTKDLKVGNVIDQKISGGQRKRLNIALELIREPSILFVDEPTSGLSSRDSENVMDLLKQLAINGKLVFVVIHQPSSDIFKLFDQLLLLDLGGYPVYFGNPTESLIYFKRLAQYVNADESECITCGNINPEQIFSVLEAKVLDEYGNQQNVRKISPEEWNQYFRKNNHSTSYSAKNESEALINNFHKLSKWKQLSVFIKRDVLSKLSNKQYLLVNLLEAPALAFVLAYFIKYHKPGNPYSFIDNPNLPAYLFMTVIVALFLGLTVSAEEIFRDRKILKRESFLNLSHGSYLWSKIAIMFLLSAIQSFLFIVIGNSIFGVKDMFLDYWLIMFTTSCFANLVGLNISSAFNSAVTIYILIPFIIIPQLLLSGVIVKFEKLNPTISSQTKVPILGEIMASRWAFEALAVNQFKNNEYEKQFFPYDKQMSEASFRNKFWIGKMEDKISECENLLNKGKPDENLSSDFELLHNEIKDEMQVNPSVVFNQVDLLTPEKFSADVANRVKDYLKRVNKFYIDSYNKANSERDNLILQFQKSKEDARDFNELKKDYTNDALEDLVMNKNDKIQILEANNRLIQHFQPVYMDGGRNNFLRTGFYVSEKNIFGNYLETFWVNLGVIWCMTIALIITLYFNVLKRLIKLFESLSGK
jgi:ABC-type multidrug transport system ATPase subunit